MILQSLVLGFEVERTGTCLNLERYNPTITALKLERYTPPFHRLQWCQSTAAEVWLDWRTGVLKAQAMFANLAYVRG